MIGQRSDLKERCTKNRIQQNCSCKWIFNLVNRIESCGLAKS